MLKREFALDSEYPYNRSSAARWIISHISRYPVYLIGTIVFGIVSQALMSYAPVLIGQAFDEILKPDTSLQMLLWLSLGVLGAQGGHSLFNLGRNLAIEVLGQRLERDARDELYASLLGKSQTFHDRQRVGDMMARANNDVRQLNFMMNPGVNLIFGSLLGLVIPIIAIGLINAELLLVPLLFCLFFYITLKDYTRRLNPVAVDLRMQFGNMNAGLAESVSGIEVVKAYAQELQERRKFSQTAGRFRDLFVRQGEIEARYLPLLVLSVAMGLGFLHALLMFQRDALGVGEVVAYMGLLGLLRFPTFISIFTFALVQLGLAGSERILDLINTETELDENEGGVSQPMRGEVVFENVTFSYNGAPVLKNISFRAEPGGTVAIVGQTGSGKTTLTKLVNRIYDVNEGRVLIDGVDVRDWHLNSLRSQISTIEQDVFLFARTIAENIAFGANGSITQETIERYAEEAQAHEFIQRFPNGYNTHLGERGVTLSGGQRQRIAIARAFLTDPRILILDDSTSAVDSATEDRIQQAMQRIMHDRTTFLITHRVSQIRWADHILVLRKGALVDQGSHEELIQRCEAYRRIFARYGDEEGTEVDGR